MGLRVIFINHRTGQPGRSHQENIMNKKILAALSIPGLILGGAAVAGAQTDGTATGTDADNTATVEKAPAAERGHRGGAGKFAEALGIDAAELRTAIQSGSTIAEIAADNGIDIDSVIADMVAEADTRVAANPDSERAQNFDAAALTERLTSMVNGEIDLADRGQRGDKAGFGETVAEALGLEQSEIREAVQSGQTIADLAEAQGVDLDVIVDQIVAAAQARVDAKLAEDPTAERALAFDAAELEQKVTDRLNGEGERSERGDRGSQGGRGGARGGAPAADAEAAA